MNKKKAFVRLCPTAGSAKEKKEMSQSLGGFTDAYTEVSGRSSLGYRQHRNGRGQAAYRRAGAHPPPARRPREEPDNGEEDWLVVDPLAPEQLHGESKLCKIRLQLRDRDFPTDSLDKYRDFFKYAVWQQEDDRNADGEIVGKVWMAYIELRARERIQKIIEKLRMRPGTFQLQGMENGHMKRDVARERCMDESKRVPGTEFHEWGAWELTERDQMFVRLQARVNAGESVESIRAAYPALAAQFCFYIDKLIADRDRTQGRLPRNVQVYLFYGTTGTGKTTRAYADACAMNGGDPGKVWILDNIANVGRNGGTVWFDGYKKQDTIIIDDYMGREYPFGQLLRWLDGKIPLQVAIKGGMVLARWTTVYITTNIPFDEWTDPTGPVHPSTRAALWRRMTHVHRFTGIDQFVVEKAPLPPPPLVASSPAVVEEVPEDA